MQKDKMISIERYTPEMKEEWDARVAVSRNATFLFLRDYMDYHADRFADHSLIAFKNGRPVALLPACESRSEEGRVLHSHSGLTYGGWVLPQRHADASDVLAIFETMTEYAKVEGFTAIDYKPLPDIYSAMPSQEDRYALFRIGAQRMECNISCAVNLRANPGFNTQQRRNLKKGAAAAPDIRECADPEEFHQLLSGSLRDRHGVAPVHSLEELRLLQGRFPGNIRIFIASAPESDACPGEECKAGVCVFDTGRVAHAQYICSTGAGRREGVLTYLFGHLIGEIFARRDYFDFGTSNESHGLLLNEGLYRQKSGLGGSGVAYERYLIPLK